MSVSSLVRDLNAIGIQKVVGTGLLAFKVGVSTSSIKLLARDVRVRPRVDLSPVDNPISPTTVAIGTISSIKS